jgi:hypothetical protein
MLLKNGSRGAEVKQLQTHLGLTADGIFGNGTEAAVKKWQADNGLVADGIVGSKTWAKMEAASTDSTEKFFETAEGLSIETHFMPKGEYKSGPTEKEYLFLHHTAGWHNPYNIIRSWDRDSSTIATEFVMGGPSIKGNGDEYDGRVLQAFPEGGYAWHLGKNGSQHMHTHSVGIEVCNFGYLQEGGYSKWDRVNKKRVWVPKTPGKFYTYVGTEAADSQVVKLSEEFRKHQFWHRYSDEQIESLRQFILFIAERDSIDVRVGLIQEVKKYGAKGFEFNENAFYGKTKGMWTHTNTRKDKFDMFPQQELLDMLVDL